MFLMSRFFSSILSMTFRLNRQIDKVELLCVIAAAASVPLEFCQKCITIPWGIQIRGRSTFMREYPSLKILRKDPLNIENIFQQRSFYWGSSGNGQIDCERKDFPPSLARSIDFCSGVFYGLNISCSSFSVSTRRDHLSSLFSSSTLEIVEQRKGGP